MRRLSVRSSLGALVLLLALQVAALAQDLVQSRAVLVDAARTLTLEDVRGRAFTPAKPILFYGYGPEAIWVRVGLAPAPPGAESVVLRFRPAYLDDIVVFDPLNDDRPQVTGDRWPASNDSYRSNNLNIVVPAAAQAREIYIRLTTSSTRTLYIEALPLAAAVEKDRLQTLAVSIYLGFLLAVLLLTVFHAMISRELIACVFAFKQALDIVWTLQSLGVPRALPVDWPPLFIDVSQAIGVHLYTGAAALFFIALIDEYGPRLWTRILLWLLACWAPVGIGLILSGHAPIAIKINAVVGLAGVLLMFVSTLACQPRQDGERPIISKWTLAALNGLLCLLSGVSILSALGVTELNDWSRELAIHSLLIYGFFSTALISTFMFVRARRKAASDAQARVELAVAHEQARQERLRREHQEQLLTMLTHEIKTPLSVLRMLANPERDSSPAMSRAIAQMTAVLDRAVSSNEMEKGRLAFRPSRFDLVADIRKVIAKTQDPARFRTQAPERAEVMTDRELAHVVIGNLVDNAVKYSTPSSDIFLRCALRSGAVVLTIDNAITETDDVDPARVFDKFYRSREAHRRTGSGIGLYMVRGIVRDMLEGAIGFELDARRVSVTVKLPLEPSAAQPDEAAAHLA